MVQISNNRGPLHSTTPRFGLIEVSVMHLSERCLTPLKHCSKHHFNQKPGFSLALLLSSAYCLFTVSPYAGLPTEQRLLFLREPTD